MSLTPTIKTSFNTGEISPRAFGRSDLSKYLAGAETLENFVVQKQGGIARRPGTRYVADVKTHADLTILYPFRVSTVANYIIEFGDQYCRFYTDRGVLLELDASTPEELTTPWTTDDLRELKFTQSADVLYVCHPDYQPRKIQRVSATQFQIRSYEPLDGPYLARNTTGTFFNLSANVDNPSISAITQAVNAQVTTSSNHGFRTGVTVTFSNDVGGMTEIRGLTSVITVTGATTFTCDDINSSAFTAYTSGGSVDGWITLDAQDADGNVNVNGINDGAGFAPGDVGRHIRWIEADDDTTWLKIQRVPTVSITATNTANPVNVQATAHGFNTGDIVHLTGIATATSLNDKAYTITRINANNFTLDGVDGTDVGAGTGGTANDAAVVDVSIEGANVESGQETRRSWALGAWSDFVGWPRCAVFHQQRLWFAGTAIEPQTIWGSESGVYDQFSPTLTAALEVTDDLAITRSIDSDEIQNIYQMHSHTRGLLVMTDGGEWVGSTSAGSFEPLTPSNFGLLIQSAHGSKPNVRSWQAGNSVLFPQFSGFKVREFVFRFEDDQFIANDLTELAEHIGGEDGFVDSAYQEEPDPTLWLVRSDGQLVGLTYDRSQKVFAFHRHILGGTYRGSDPVVESCAVIRDDPYDLLWIVVRRTIDGSDVRYVEYVGDRFESSDDEEEAFFVDCGLASSEFFTEFITSITKGNPTTFTSTRNGVLPLPSTTTVKVRDIQSSGDLASTLNDNTYTLTSVSDVAGVHTFTLNVDTSATSGEWQSGGTVRKQLTTVTGLDHLEGETVKVAGDGSPQADQTVASGSITLATAASIVYVGLENTSTYVGLPMLIASGAESRTSELRAAKIWLMMYQTQGGTVGQKDETLDAIEYDDTNLFTGIKDFSITGVSALRFQLKIVSDSIYPMNILQIGAEVDSSAPSRSGSG